MTDPHNREADIPENEGAPTAPLAPMDETPAPSQDDLPAAASDGAPLPESEPEHAEPSESAEHADPTDPSDPTDPTDLTSSADSTAAEESQESHEGQAPAAAGTPAPPQRFSSRVEALEQQVEAAQDRARLVARVQALRKRIEDAPPVPEEPTPKEPAPEEGATEAVEAAEPPEDRGALIERLQRLEALCQEQLDENYRRKEELAVKAEALSPSEEWKSTSEAIKALQAEWKTIGPVPQERSQELWQRFRKAGNAFFERLQEHRKESSQGTEENLHLKEALCVRAEELSQSTDWKGTAEAIKALQAEWKAVGPAPREQADAVWKRFRKAADVFFARRKEHSDTLRKEQEENLRRKEALVARAEELSQSTQWKATVQMIKEVQAEWRTIGPAPSNKAESVWRRFRAAIDLFFERQAAYFSQRNQDVGKRQDQMLDALERKREQANRVREQIERDEENLQRWKTNLADVHPGERSEELRAGLDAKITDVEAKLPGKRQRLDELEATIREIAAKLT
jgi:hypothetical protein